MFHNRALFSPLLILAALGFSPAFAGSQYVIVGAEPAAEGLAPGRIVNLGETLDVPAGTLVTLLGEDGSVSAIPGPASITVTDDGVAAGADSEAKRSAISKIAGLLAGEKKNSGALGVARSIAEKSGSQAAIDPWAVPFQGDGQGCVRGEAIVLGRADASPALILTVSAGTNEARDLAWKSGEANLTLPALIPATSREIEIKSGGKISLVQLHALPGDISADDPLGVLGWMLSSGCDAQALTFTRQLAGKGQ